VKAIRYPIGWLMAIVAIAALDFGAIRAATDEPLGSHLMLCVVVLPMVNFMAVGLLIGHRYPGTRRFLLGFEAFGVVSLAFLVAQNLSGKDWVWSYLTLASEPFRTILGPSGGGKWSTSRLLLARAFLSFWATLPQLTFALMGGFLCQKAGAVDSPEGTRGA
jgi:hypothetical protein